MVDAGELIVLRRGVYGDAAVYEEADDAKKHAFYGAAATVLNRDAVISHQSAAAIHGLDLFQPPGTNVTVTVPPGAHASRKPRPGLHVHVADLPAAHIAKAYGLSLTTPARTVVDLARTLSFMTAVVTADSALHTGTVFKHELAGVLAYCRRWVGAAQAARVIEFADQLAESPLESCARVMFAEHGLPPPVLQAAIQLPGFIARVDFLWREFGTVSEADGKLKYKDPERARYQLRRDQYLREATYKVVHFTHVQLFTETDRVIGWHREAFRRASAY
jgi:hypothetical protein